MSQIFLSSVFLLLSPLWAYSQGIAGQAADHRIEWEINSQFLNEIRAVTIYTPEGYHQDAATTYPVLYVLDGNRRSKDTVYISRFLKERRQAPGLIVVSIPSTGQRDRDFYPFIEKTGLPNPGVDHFSNFLGSELIPRVEANLRTKPHRMLLGHSAAGVFVVHTLLTHPHRFKSLMAFSPALHHNRPVIPAADKFLATAADLNTRIYLNIGLSEFLPIRTEFENLQRVFDHYKPKGLRFHFQEFPHDGHTTTPFVGLYSALKAQFVQARPSLERFAELSESDGLFAWFDQLSHAFGYPVIPSDRSLMSFWSYFTFQSANPQAAATALAAAGRYYPQQAKSGNMGFVIHWNHHGMTKAYDGGTAPPDENFINNLAYQVLAQSKFEEAIHLFELNTRLHANSANVYDSLAEALEAANQLDRAHQNYQKAVTMARQSKDQSAAAYAANLNRFEEKWDRRH